MFRRFLNTAIRALANEGVEDLPEGAAANAAAIACEVISLADLEQAERGKDGKGRWVMLAPFGTHPHSAGPQVIGEREVAWLANSILAKLKMAAGGLPWFKGHPDHKDYKDTDMTRFAVTRELRVTEGGLEGLTFFTPEAKEKMKRGEWLGYSPHWQAYRDKAGNWHPFELTSVGFTNRPQIQQLLITAAMANARPAPAPTPNPQPDKTQPNDNKKMNQKLINRLIAAGFLKPDDADNENAQIAAFDALANEAKRAKELDAQAAALANEKTAAEARCTALEGQVSAQQKARAEAEVDARIRAGAIPAGKRDETVASLANAKPDEVAGKIAALPKIEDATLKTSSQVKGAPDKGAADVKSLANEYLEKAGGDPAKAMRLMKAAHPDACKLAEPEPAK